LAVSTERHREFLRKTTFFVPDSVSRTVTPAQLALLVRYGHWLEALAKGILSPVTSQQEHFVRAAAGHVEPTTDYEVAWVAYWPPGSYRRRPRAPEPDDFEDMGRYGEGG
jgi:uncharacterized protein YifE (UPF0438 family)